MAVRRVKRSWFKVASYNPHVPGIPHEAEREWRECARWVVLFGPEFAEAFGMHSDIEIIARRAA